jgi:hypothetical protein
MNTLTKLTLLTSLILLGLVCVTGCETASVVGPNSRKNHQDVLFAVFGSMITNGGSGDQSVVFVDGPNALVERLRDSYGPSFAICSAEDTKTKNKWSIVMRAEIQSLRSNKAIVNAGIQSSGLIEAYQYDVRYTRKRWYVRGRRVRFMS